MKLGHITRSHEDKTAKEKVNRPTRKVWKVAIPLASVLLIMNCAGQVKSTKTVEKPTVPVSEIKEESRKYGEIERIVKEHLSGDLPAVIMGIRLNEIARKTPEDVVTYLKGKMDLQDDKTLEQILFAIAVAGKKIDLTNYEGVLQKAKELMLAGKGKSGPVTLITRAAIKNPDKAMLIIEELLYNENLNIWFKCLDELTIFDVPVPAKFTRIFERLKKLAIDSTDRLAYGKFASRRYAFAVLVESAVRYPETAVHLDEVTKTLESNAKKDKDPDQDALGILDDLERLRHKATKRLKPEEPINLHDLLKDLPTRDESKQ
ncbi:MAG: hypothetical protein V1492_04710 [Candidatus Micrarchaeota archaeon]